ncbi:hypothetical protein BH09MYX1_BH09MYX1_45670 [soil metagenome]
MTSTKTLALLAATGILLGACGGKETPPASPKVDPAASADPSCNASPTDKAFCAGSNGTDAGVTTK